MTTKQLLRGKAIRLIERKDTRVTDLCAEYGQILANVGHMEWFINAVIGEIL